MNVAHTVTDSTFDSNTAPLGAAVYLMWHAFGSALHCERAHLIGSLHSGGTVSGVTTTFERTHVVNNQVRNLGTARNCPAPRLNARAGAGILAISQPDPFKDGARYRLWEPRSTILVLDSVLEGNVCQVHPSWAAAAGTGGAEAEAMVRPGTAAAAEAWPRTTGW